MIKKQAILKSIHNHDVFITSSFANKQSISKQLLYQNNSISDNAQTDNYKQNIINMQQIKIKIRILFDELIRQDRGQRLKLMINQIIQGIDLNKNNKLSLTHIIFVQGFQNILQRQMNQIKLNTLFSQLKGLQKEVYKLSKTNKNKKIDNQSFGLKLFTKSKLNKQRNYQLKEQEKTKNIQNYENNQLRKKLIQQISYRQKIEAFESSAYLKKKEQFLIKRAEKSRQMNRKVKQINQNKKKQQKETIQKFKIITLYSPKQIQVIKKRKNLSKTTYLYNRPKHLKDQSLDNQDLQIGNSSFEKDIKGSIQITSKTGVKSQLNEMNFKGLCSKISKHKTLFINKSSSSQPNLEQQKSNQKLNKNKSQLLMMTSFNLDQRIQNVRKRRQQIQKQREQSIMKQVIKKQSKIYNLKNKIHIKKDEKSQNHSQRNDLNQNSRVSSMKNTYFKKIIVTKKQLLDKQNRILNEIQQKSINKQIFLKNRANKVHQKLKNQQLLRKNHHSKWQQSLKKQRNNQIYKSCLQSQNKQLNDQNNTIEDYQQKSIRQKQLKLQKKNELKKKLHKICTLPLTQLKKKLQEINRKQQQQNIKKSLFF